MPLGFFSRREYEALGYASLPLRFEQPIQQGWREGFLISWSYGMGDPVAPIDSEGYSEEGGTARRFASRQATRAGVTRP